MSTNSKNCSVALQQKVGTKVDYANLTNEQLHQQTLNARNKFYQHCSEAHDYAVDALIPACEAIIARYKMQGVAAKDRPNGKPTVEAYFKSIDLNYNTVRSWIHRKRLQTEMFQSKKVTVNGNGGKEKVQHLTELEAKLLGTASAGHDLVKAIKHGGNMDEAITAFEDAAPTLQRIEEYIECPVTEAANRLKGLESEKLAKALSAEVARLVEESDNRKRVRICGKGKDPIPYDTDAECFGFTVLVQKQELTDEAPER